MIDLLPNLLPLLLVDVLNPMLFALMLVAIGTSKPFANSISFLAGHTASYFVSGVLIALGLDRILERLNNPHPVDFVLELVDRVFSARIGDIQCCLRTAIFASADRGRVDRRAQQTGVGEDQRGTDQVGRHVHADTVTAYRCRPECRCVVVSDYW